MARSNTGSASNYFTTTCPVASGSTTHTLACWFRPDSATVSSNLITITNAAGTSYSALHYDGDNSYSTGDNRLVFDGSNGSPQIATNATAINTTGTWNHGAAVLSAANNRVVYVNGSGGTAATGTHTPTGLADMSIGAFKGSSTSVFSPMNGAIAEVGVWDVALTASEIAALAKGASPLLIRPASLVSYIPFLGRGTERDWLRSAAITTVGTMAQAAHPPGLKGPQDAFVPVPDAGGGGGTATGATVTEQTSLVAGSATGAADRAGATVTLNTAPVSGAATGAATAATVTLTEQESVLAGSATGAASGAAATSTLNTSLIAGAATGAASAATVTVTEAISAVAGAATGAASAAAATVTETTSVVAGAATGGTTAAPATVTLNTSLIAGAASGAASVAGATVSEAAAILAGAATTGGAGTASGVTVSGVASLLAGAVTGAASATGATVAGAASLLAGTASSGSGGAQSAVAPPVRASFDRADISWDSTSTTFDAESTRVFPSAKLSLISGAAEVNRTGQGVTLTATISLIPGTAISDTAPVVAGATVTTVTTLLAGSAASDEPVMVSGTTLGFAASLIAGSATGAVTTSTAVTWDATTPTWDTTGVTFDTTAAAPVGVFFIGAPTYSVIAGAAIGAGSAAGAAFGTQVSFIGSPANIVDEPGTAQGSTVTTVVSFEAGRARGQGWAKLPEGAPAWTNVAKPGDGWTVVPRPGGTWDKAA